MLTENPLDRASAKTKTGRKGWHTIYPNSFYNINSVRKRCYYTSLVSTEHVLKPFMGNKVSISSWCFDWWWNRWGMRQSLLLWLSPCSTPSLLCFVLFWNETLPGFHDMCPAFDRRRWQIPILSPLLLLSQIWHGFFEISLRGEKPLHKSSSTHIQHDEWYKWKVG